MSDQQCQEAEDEKAHSRLCARVQKYFFYQGVPFVSVLLVLGSCSIKGVVLVNRRSVHKPNISSGDHLPHLGPHFVQCCKIAVYC